MSLTPIASASASIERLYWKSATGSCRAGRVARSRRDIPRPAAPPTPATIVPIAKRSVLRRMSRQLRIMCRRRKWPPRGRSRSPAAPRCASAGGGRRNHREAGREHDRVELGDLGEIDPEVLRRGSSDLLDQVAQIAGQLGSVISRLDPAISSSARSISCQMPCSSLSVDRAGADQRYHVGGADPRQCARSSADAAAAPADEQRAPADLEGHGCAHPRGPRSAARTLRPALIRLRSRSTICSRPVGSAGRRRQPRALGCRPGRR